MSLIEELYNASKYLPTFQYVISNTCWHCEIHDIIQKYDKVFLIDGIIMPTCLTCLPEINRIFKSDKIVELSLQDIFYLKCK